MKVQNNKKLCEYINTILTIAKEPEINSLNTTINYQLSEFKNVDINISSKEDKLCDDICRADDIEGEINDEMREEEWEYHKNREGEINDEMTEEEWEYHKNREGVINDEITEEEWKYYKTRAGGQVEVKRSGNKGKKKK